MYLLDTNTLIYFFKGMGNVADILLAKSPKDISMSYDRKWCLRENCKNK